MSLAVTVLGSSGMFATLERACSGYLVEIDGARVWLDAGAGTWRALLGYMGYAEIDAIVLSHRHPDHTTDVFQAFHARRYGGPEPLPPIPLWAPEETLDVVSSYVPRFGEAFDLKPISETDEVELAGATISFARMAHPPVTLGVRVEADHRVFAYSADTGPDGDFETLARGARLLICEATFQDRDGPWPGHMRASEAGDVAARLEVGGLVLTHLPPGRDHAESLEQARAAAGNVPVELAHDGCRWEV